MVASRGLLQPERARSAVADRTIRYPLLWLVFVLVMVVGAGMVSAGGSLFWLGLLMLACPLVALGLLAGVYYVRQRRRPRTPRDA